MHTKSNQRMGAFGEEVVSQYLIALHKIVRVAWTLADLHAHEIPTLAEVTQAHLMRAGVEL